MVIFRLSCPDQCQEDWNEDQLLSRSLKKKTFITISVVCVISNSETAIILLNCVARNQ